MVLVKKVVTRRGKERQRVDMISDSLPLKYLSIYVCILPVRFCISYVSLYIVITGLNICDEKKEQRYRSDLQASVIGLTAISGVFLVLYSSVKGFIYLLTSNLNMNLLTLFN